MCSARKRSVLSAQPVKVYVKPSLYVPEEKSVIQGSPSRSHIMKHARATSRNDGPGEREKNSSRAKKKICSVVVQSVPGYLMLTKLELTAFVSVRAGSLMEFLLPMMLSRDFLEENHAFVCAAIGF